MANRLRVTELDFDTIKTNLKTFLKQQTEFSDYDFEGAGLSVLLDILAYNTHYNAYYLNMVANEGFLDTALLRNSVVSHAKKLGYTPRSNRASKAVIDVTINGSTSAEDYLTIPRGYTFISGPVEGKIYTFITLQDYTVSKTGTNFVYNDIEIFEGKLLSYSYNHSDISNPKQIYEIPDAKVDTTTLRVTVQQSSSNTETVVYNPVDDSISLTSDSKTYFLQEGQSGKYQIYFGDNIVGKKLPDGAVLTISYLISNGEDANKAANFTGSASINYLTGFTINTVTVAAGGRTRETVDEIRFAAPLQYISQNRAVTKNDYIKLIQQKYPQFEAVNVWGGEENDPPVYGKVFISAKPKDGFEITDTEKDFFLQNVLKPISVMTVTPQIVDVDYNYLKMISTVYYDPTKTILDLNTLRTKVRTSILDFCNTNLNSFNAYFRSSALKTAIDSCDISVISNELEVFIAKKFRPDLITTSNYILDFGVELQRGTTNDNFYTSPNFTVLDENGITRSAFIEEVPSSFTGVESITVTNPGINYSSTPTVAILGDGQGAKAEATIINGRLSYITVTNPGVGYTTAAIVITGGGGTLATGSAVLENRYGQIRIAYFRPDETSNQSVKSILNYQNNNGVMGQIDYTKGKIYINNFNPLSVANDFDELSVHIRPSKSVIHSEKNKLLTFDVNDSTTIVINIVPIK